MHGNGELPGGADGHSDVVDGEVGVGGDDGTGGEVHTLTGQVGPEPSLLTLEPLGQGLEGPSGPVPCGRDSGGLVVEVGGDVVLQELPEILDDELGCTVVTVLPEPLVDPEDIDQLVGEVILGPVSGLQGDGGPDGHGGNGEGGEDHPLGPADGGVHSERPEVVVGDPLEPLADLEGGQLLVVLVDDPEGGGLVELDLALLSVTVGTDSPVGGRLDGLLAVVLLIDGVSSEVGDGVQPVDPVLDLLGGKHEPAALAAGGLQHELDVLHESDVDYGHGELDASEVSGTLVDLAVAGLAAESGLDDSHAGIHETALDGVSLVVVGVGGDDLHRGHVLDLFRRDAGELDGSDFPIYSVHERSSS